MRKKEKLKKDEEMQQDIENEETAENATDSEEEIDSNLDAQEAEMDEDGKNFEELYNQKLKELEESNNNYLRLQADFTNYKKRVKKEKDAIYMYAAEEVITELLGVLDNFERALGSVEDKEKDSGLYQGVEMIHNQLISSLQKAGLQEIEALNESFDPNLHHGVAQEPSEDHEEDTILEVFQKGYKLKEKVIRPSMVKISK